MKNIINIFNGDLQLSIKTDPIEMISLKKGEVEFLYQRDGTWAKTSPLLFPICGKLKDDSFTHNSKIFKIPKHGFVQEYTKSKWVIKEQRENKVVFSLSSDKELLGMYPFEFELIMDFELINSSELNIKSIMKNKSTSSELFYSLGHHPAFITAEDGVIKFDKVEEFRDVFPNGFVDINYEKYNTDEIKVKDVNWNPDMNPAILKLASENVKYKDSKREVNFSITDFESMLLWTKDGGTKWLCFEPWNGLPDFVDEDIIEIAKKRGVVKIDKNNNHTSNLLISLKTYK